MIYVYYGKAGILKKITVGSLTYLYQSFCMFILSSLLFYFQLSENYFGHNMIIIQGKLILQLVNCHLKRWKCREVESTTSFHLYNKSSTTHRAIHIGGEQ